MKDLVDHTPDTGGHGLARHRNLAWIVGIAIIVATLSNGAEFFFRKVGALETERYKAFWILHCSSMGLPASGTHGVGCCHDATDEQLGQMAELKHRQLEMQFGRKLREVDAAGFVLKIVKDMLFLTLIAGSALLVATGRANAGCWRNTWPGALLLFWVLLTILGSLLTHGNPIALVGVRPFLFLMVALLCGWLAPHVSILAACIAALVVLQVPLVAIELAYGMHVHGHGHGHRIALPLSDFQFLHSRTSGALVGPNTLGSIAVICLAFYYGFSRTRKHLPLLVLTTIFLAFASGSGTAFVTIPVFLGVLAIEGLGLSATRMSLMLATAAICLIAVWLPEIAGRPDLYDSIAGPGGRLDSAFHVLGQLDWAEIVFGVSPGLNTNAAVSLGHAGFATGAGGSAGSFDSTPTALVLQFGIVGATLFYGTLLWAASRDAKARAFYLVFALASLTLNVTEAFPANMLLGLALAHSSLMPSRTKS